MEDAGMDDVNYKGYEQGQHNNPMNSPQWSDPLAPEPYYNELEMNEAGDLFRDYHAVNTIQLCELLNSGFDLLFDYNKNNPDIARIVELAKRHYWFREIAGSPWEFKQDFNRIIGEQMNRLRPMYNILHGAELDIRSGGATEHKERNIHSEYPQSQIKTNGQDYASNADDRELIDSNTIGDLEAVERYTDLLQRMDSLDMQVVNALAVAFNPFITSFVNL